MNLGVVRIYREERKLEKTCHRRRDPDSVLLGQRTPLPPEVSEKDDTYIRHSSLDLLLRMSQASSCVFIPFFAECMASSQNLREWSG